MVNIPCVLEQNSDGVRYSDMSISSSLLLISIRSFNVLFCLFYHLSRKTFKSYSMIVDLPTLFSFIFSFIFLSTFFFFLVLSIYALIF